MLKPGCILLCISVFILHSRRDPLFEMDAPPPFIGEIDSLLGMDAPPLFTGEIDSLFDSAAPPTAAPNARATRGVGRPVSSASDLTKPQNFKKLARRRELKKEKQKFAAAQEKVREDPSAANVQLMVDASDNRHGRRHHPELATIGQQNRNLVKLRENGVNLCVGMSSDE